MAPRRTARAVASARVFTRSFRRIEATWWSTGALGEHEPLCDRAIRQPFGDQRENLGAWSGRRDSRASSGAARGYRGRGGPRPQPGGRRGPRAPRRPRRRPRSRTGRSAPRTGHRAPLGLRAIPTLPAPRRPARCVEIRRSARRAQASSSRGRASGSPRRARMSARTTSERMRGVVDVRGVRMTIAAASAARSQLHRRSSSWPSIASRYSRLSSWFPFSAMARPRSTASATTSSLPWASADCASSLGEGRLETSGSPPSPLSIAPTGFSGAGRSTAPQMAGGPGSAMPASKASRRCRSWVRTPGAFSTVARSIAPTISAPPGSGLGPSRSPGYSIGDFSRFGPARAWAFSGEPIGQSATFHPIVLFTGDGGRNWSRVQLGDDLATVERTSASLRQGVLWLLSASIPGAGSQPKRLYRSDDVGASWRLIADSPMGTKSQFNTLPLAGYATDLTVSPGGNLFLAGGRSTLYMSTDGGVKWRAAIPPSLANPGDGGVSPPVFVDALHGWEMTQPGIFRTDDGGLTWELATLPKAPPTPTPTATPVKHRDRSWCPEPFRALHPPSKQNEVAPRHCGGAPLRSWGPRRLPRAGLCSAVSLMVASGPVWPAVA